MWTDEMTREIVRHNGGTFQFIHPATGWIEAEFPDGYWVSLQGGIENLPRLRVQTIIDFIEARPHLKERKTYLGVWNSLSKNSTLQNWSVDETVWVENYEDALIVAKDNNQSAIYEVVTDTEILTKH